MYELHLYADIVIMCADRGCPITVGEVQDKYVGMPKSTMQRYLSKLVKFGWIKRVKRGHYYPQLNDVTEALFQITANS